MVENILFVYSTWTNKAPIGAADWGIVDSHLLAMELRQDPSDPLIRIANSGYDATHRCGFIACKDLASADWCKRTIHGIGGSQYGEKGAFRAWSKGEQPESRLCRLFFPSRFDSLDDFALELSLLKHNPPLKQGTVTVKGMDDVQNGRALFIEVDIDSYAYIKSKGFKVEFPLMDIDCQLYIPPPKTGLIQWSGYLWHLKTCQPPAVSIQTTKVWNQIGCLLRCLVYQFDPSSLIIQIHLSSPCSDQGGPPSRPSAISKSPSSSQLQQGPHPGQTGRARQEEPPGLCLFY